MEAYSRLLVGVDEAGYGPNLGPLVVVAVWVQADRRLSSRNLWDCLAPVVQRYPGLDQDAFVVDDSKRVYSAMHRVHGLRRLERAALGWLGLQGHRPNSLRELWNCCCLTPVADMDQEPSCQGDVPLPHLLSPELLQRDQPALACALNRAKLGSPGAACQIILPCRFNQLVRHGNKAGALFQANAQLLRYVWESQGANETEVVLDKHGGRNFYAPLLQREFMEALVLAGREGAAASHYTIHGCGRRLQAKFIPEADQQHLLVAIASMTAKYLREMFMGMFNSFWAKHVPGLQPTAGYPSDSHRFWRAIQPVSARLGISSDLVWRCR